MSDYFTMTTYDNGHLLMCEKEDLVEYIECLRLDVKHEKQETGWQREQLEKLKEQRKPLTRSDTRIKQLEEQLKELQEENDKILGIMSSYDSADDVSNELDRLSEIEDCIWCDLWGYDCVEHDTKLYRLQYEFKELKKLKEENDGLKEQLNKLNKKIRSLKSFRNHYKNSYEDEKRKNDGLKEFINQQKVTVVKLDEHGQELSK